MVALDDDDRDGFCPPNVLLRIPSTALDAIFGSFALTLRDLHRARMPRLLARARARVCVCVFVCVCVCLCVFVCVRVWMDQVVAVHVM